MIAERKCLEILNEELGKNIKNPHPELYFMTRCLKNWYTRINLYTNMKSYTMTTFERRNLCFNKWGEDTTLERLIKERKLPLQTILNLIYQIQDIEFDMDQKNIYDRTSLVIPVMQKLIILFKPLWLEEVKTHKLDQQKNHPEIKKIVHFTLNLRETDVNNDEVLDFFLKLLNENF